MLLKSYYHHGGERAHYMVATAPDFAERVKQMASELDMELDIWIIDGIETVFDAACSRLRIFEYPRISEYSKILYLDTDILITNNIYPLFDYILEDKLYGMEEGETCHPFWGGDLFPQHAPSTAFSSGVLLFNNCQAILELFQEIRDHIRDYISNGNKTPTCFDQPFIVHHAFQKSLYDNQWLNGKVVNNPSSWNGEIISHFAGEPGNNVPKYFAMNRYIDKYMIYINTRDKISMDAYRSVIDKNRHILQRLKDICLESGEKVEGNCFTEHLNIHHEIEGLFFKQANHFVMGKVATHIMEIGFNAGHSTLLYLLSNPKCHVTVFDLCEHRYTIPCFQYLAKIFPGRLEMHSGDSTVTVPQYIANHPGKQFDLIHVDGCHITSIARKDLENALKLTNRYIIWDDTQIPNLNELFEEALNKKRIDEVFLYPTVHYKHRICKVMV